MKKDRLVLQICLIIAMVAMVIVASVVLESAETKYATELALEQMEIEGSQEYAIYHDIVMRWEAIANVATVAVIVLSAWMIIDIFVQKFIKKSRRKRK